MLPFLFFIKKIQNNDPKGQGKNKGDLLSIMIDANYWFIVV